MRTPGHRRERAERLAAVLTTVAIVSSACVPQAAHAACTGTPANVTCTGTVTSPGDGVTATSATTDVAVTIASGSVTGARHGINATAAQYKNLNITTVGNATGTSGAGILATTDIEYSQIDIGAASTVTGQIGVFVRSNGGYGRLSNNGAIVGTGASGLAFDLGVGTEDINNNGSVTGTQGIAVSVGSGTVVLNNNETGTVNGMIAGNATTTVNNFGTWKNAGGSTIGVLNSAGTLSLSAPNATSTLTVLGDAKFAANASTTLNIAPGGASDAILVGGDLTIQGGALNIHAIGAGYRKGQTYTLLSTTGVVTGSFASIQSDLPKFLPLLALQGGNLTISLWQYDFRDLALTRNQYAAASAIAQAATVTMTPAGAALITGLNGATDAQLQAGLTQIAGDGVTAAKSVALRQGSLFMGLVGEQQAFWRSRESVDPNGFTIAPLAYAPVATGPGWYAGQKTPLPPRPAPLPADRTIRMWVAGFGGEQTTAGAFLDGSAATRGRVGGGAVGVDAQIGRNVLLGVSGGYSVGSFSAAERQTSGQNTGMHVAIYTGFTANGFYGAANVGYAAYGTTTTRQVAVAGLAPERETGSFDSREVRVHFEAGKLFDLGIGSVTAFTAMEGATLTSKPYVERSFSSTGAGLLGLGFLEQSTRSVPIEIGFRAETRLRMGSATLAPWAQVSLVHDFSVARNQNEYLAVFPGVPQTVYGARDARDTLRLKGGAQLTFSPRAAMFVSAEADLAKSQRAYSGKGGFRYGW